MESEFYGQEPLMKSQKIIGIKPRVKNDFQPFGSSRLPKILYKSFSGTPYGR